MKRNYARTALWLSGILTVLLFLSNGAWEPERAIATGAVQAGQILENAEYVPDGCDFTFQIPASASETVKTMVYMVPLDEQAEAVWKQAIAAEGLYGTGSGRLYEEAYDASNSVLLYSTLYYTRENAGGAEYLKLVKAEMGYERKDPSVSVCRTQIRLGCVDTVHQDQIYETDLYMESGCLYTIWLPSSWEEVNTCLDWTIVGGNLTLMLQRGSESEWQTVLKNVVVDRG
jgi:hypothetical protein